VSEARIASTTAAASTDASPTPFTMVPGDPAAMVCEGDVCVMPGISGDGATDAAVSPAAAGLGVTRGR